MEIRTKKRVVEIEDKEYIASDGKVFFDEKECEIYEESIAYTKAKKRVDEIEIKRLKNVFPLPYKKPDSCYDWYAVQGESDIECIDYVYNGSLKKKCGDIFKDCSKRIICVGRDMSHCFEEETVYTLEFVKEYMSEFWDMLGITLQFEQKQK